jgi:hypothetical protein
MNEIEKFILISTYVSAGIIIVLSVLVIIKVIIKNKQLKAIIVLSALYFVAAAAELTYGFFKLKKQKENIIFACQSVVLLCFGVILWTFSTKYWALSTQLSQILNIQQDTNCFKR